MDYSQFRRSTSVEDMNKLNAERLARELLNPDPKAYTQYGFPPSPEHLGNPTGGEIPGAFITQSNPLANQMGMLDLYKLQDAMEQAHPRAINDLLKRSE